MLHRQFDEGVHLLAAQRAELAAEQQRVFGCSMCMGILQIQVQQQGWIRWKFGFCVIAMNGELTSVPARKLQRRKYIRVQLMSTRGLYR